MAPRKMPGGKTKAQKRFEILRERAAQADFSTPQGSKLIFDYYQKAGYIPAKNAQGHSFKSLEEFLQTVQNKVEAVKTTNPSISDKEALRLVESRLAYNKALRSAKTGEDINKVTDLLKADPEKRLAKQRAYSGLPLTISDTGKVSINRRQYMSAEGGLPRPVFDEIASRRGIGEATRYEKAVKAEWKKMGDIGRQLSAETGVPFHRGHWLANKYGGAESARAGSLEIGALNELHGAAPRGDIKAVAETGRGSMGWLEDFTNWDLAENKLNVLGSEHLKQSDLQAISNGVDPNRLIAQRTAEYEARGMVPDPDEIGLIFGSQLDRNETVQSQFGRLAEEQKLSMQETGFDPRYGRPVSSERLAEVTQDVNKSKRLIPKIPKTGGRLAPVLATEPVGNRALAKKLIPKLGPVGAGLAIGVALLSDNPAEAIPVAAETLTPLGDLQGAPEPAITMVNVGGKLRPLNTDTNTLMDKPGYGLEQKGGQWREVQRGTGTASRQQSKVQAEQLIPVPKPVMANTPTGVAQLKAMPKSKNIDLINEAQYFIVNPVRSAFDRIFGKRDI